VDRKLHRSVSLLLSVEANMKISWVQMKKMYMSGMMLWPKEESCS